MDDYEKQLAAWRHRQGIKQPRKVMQATAKLPSSPEYAPAVQAKAVMKRHRESWEQFRERLTGGDGSEKVERVPIEAIIS